MSNFISDYLNEDEVNKLEEYLSGKIELYEDTDDVLIKLMEEYTKDKNFFDKEFYLFFRDYLVIFLSKEGCILRDFGTVDKVADFIGSKPYLINKVLDGKTVKGTTWKPNIYYQNIDDSMQYRYIVVNKEDWVNYSKRQKQNRLNKLTK